MQNVYMGLDVEEFIFGEGTTYEESYSNVTDEEMNEFGIIECVDDPDVACYRIALENEQNHNAIMMAMLTQEYNHVLENGTEMVYEGSRIDNFLDNVKRQIQKFWAKVKGVFKKVMDKLSTIVLSNKAFVKKYRAADIKMPTEKYFTGYMFPINDIKYSEVVKVVEGIKDATVKDMGTKDKTDTTLNEVRGKLLNTTSLTSEQFETKLKEHLYGSENTEEVTWTNWTDLLDALESANDERKKAKNAHKEAEKTIKGLLSEVNKEKSKAKSGTPSETSAKKKSEIISRSLNIMSSALSVQTRAIIAAAVQDRKMANYIVNAQNKKDVKFQKESFIELI